MAHRKTYDCAQASPQHSSGGYGSYAHLTNESHAYVRYWTLAKKRRNEREIASCSGVSGNTKLIGPMAGIAHEEWVVGRRPPPVAGAARRSRSDRAVAEPTAPGAILCFPSADVVRRGLEATDPWEPLSGQPLSPSLGHDPIPSVKFARVQYAIARSKRLAQGATAALQHTNLHQVGLPGRPV